MIKPRLQDEAFLQDVAQARREGGLCLWWLGQSGFLVSWQGCCLLIDPYLSDSLTHKYAGTDKPHVRMTGRVVAPERLDFIDVTSSSHNHTDHLDGETLIPLLQANPGMTLIVPQANRTFAAERLQVPVERLTGIRLEAPVQAGLFTFHALPAAHEALEQDENGDYRHHGYVIQAGPWALYHSGDCVPYDGLVERLSAWQIDLALLPINGRDPKRGVAGNFSGEEAARLAKDIGVGRVIPMHYDMFAFNTISPQGFIEEARRIGQANKILEAGERFQI